MGYFPQRDTSSDLLRYCVRINHELPQGLEGNVQWYGTFQDSNRPNYFHYVPHQDTIDGQLDLPTQKRHQLSIGGHLRRTHINTIEGQPEEYILPGKPYDEYSAAMFAVDRWQASEMLAFEAQLRGEWYNQTKLDWAGRLSATYSLDPNQDHLLRLSTARAFRTPLIALRRLTVQRVPIPFDGYAVNLIAPAELENEHTWSLEAGSITRLQPGLQLRVDTYYQRFERLIGGGVLAPTYYFMDNIDGANAYGGELELSRTQSRLRMSCWYAYNAFEPDQPDQFTRGMMPSKHKIGAMVRIFLPRDWVFNLNYRYTDTTPASISVPVCVPASHSLDVMVARQI